MDQPLTDSPRTPWHKPLRGKMTTVPSLRSATKTNFDVERTEMFVDLTPQEEESTFLAVPGLFCLVRADTRRPIAPVGPNTKLFQLSVWAEVALGLGALVTGGVLGSEHAYYVAEAGFTDSYEYFTAIVAEIGTNKAEAVAFACHGFAKTTHLIGSTPIRHHGDSSDSALLAKNVTVWAAQQQAAFRKATDKMAKTKLNTDGIEGITAAYGAVWSPEDRSGRAQARWQNRLSEVIQAWDDSVAIADYRNTLLGFYIALHEWSEYGRSFRGTGGDAKAIATRRPNEALLGTHRTVSERALLALPDLSLAPAPTKKAPRKAPAKRVSKKS